MLCVFCAEQEDLVPEDVMLLDCWECLYLWVGKGSNKVEREQAQVLALVSAMSSSLCVRVCVCVRVCLCVYVHACMCMLVCVCMLV